MKAVLEIEFNDRFPAPGVIGPNIEHEEIHTVSGRRRFRYSFEAADEHDRDAIFWLITQAAMDHAKACLVE